MPMENRPAMQDFDDDELLYRRVLPDHYVDGFLVPAHFGFSEPNSETGGPSFTRSKFCEPQHVTHPNCGASPPSSQWRILQCLVAILPGSIPSEDGQVFEFAARHVPHQYCYAHTEVWCFRRDDGELQPLRPPQSVRKKFRVRLSRILSECNLAA